jgi:DNA-binding MarR family transcriptional regulator
MSMLTLPFTSSPITAQLRRPLQMAGPENRAKRSAAAVPRPSHPSGSKLLQWLLRYPFQRAEDWALALGVTTSTATRQINQCEQLGLVESVSPALGADSCRLFYLSASGLLAVAALEGAEAAVLAATYGADERGLLRLLPRLHALVYLQNVVNALVARAPIALAGGGTRKELNWHWRRDYQHSFTFHGKSVHCVADAVLIFHLHPHSLLWTEAEESFYSAFILLDTGLVGNHDERVVKERLGKLLCYRECEARLPFHRFFPPVLVLVQTPRQREIWQRSALEVAAQLRLAPLCGAIVQLSRETAPASAWPLPWSDLATRASCRLEGLFQAMPRGALPTGAVIQPPIAAQPADGQGRRGPALKGNFSARAKEVAASPCLGAAERDAVSLLSLRLSRRHLDVVHHLYTRPLIARAELAILLDVQEETLERYLSDLRHYACIHAHETAADGPRLRLSSRGLRLVAAVHHIPLQHVATPPTKDDLPYIGQRVRLVRDVNRYPDYFARAGLLGRIVSTEGGVRVKMDRPLPGAESTGNCVFWPPEPDPDSPADEKKSLVTRFRKDCQLIEDDPSGELVQRSIRVLLRRLVDNQAALKHTAGIYEFIARLHQACTPLGHQVLWWEMGSRCEHRYRDHNSWHNLRPDAELLYAAGERRISAWLEWDEGTMSRQNLDPKMGAYKSFATSREWSVKGMRTLPLLLIVTPYKGQEQRVIQAAQEKLDGCGLSVYTTTATRVRDKEQGPLAPIWAQAVPIPGTLARRRLSELTRGSRREKGDSQ